MPSSQHARPHESTVIQGASEATGEGDTQPAQHDGRSRQDSDERWSDIGRFRDNGDLARDISGKLEPERTRQHLSYLRL
jgi:hypothetical protein